MSYYELGKRLSELDRKIQEAEKEMESILEQLGIEKIESLNDIRDARLRERYDRLQLQVKDFKRKKKGGFRANSGRKSKYDGFKTCVIRVPEIFRNEVERFIEEKMAAYGCEKHQTEYEKRNEAEKEVQKAKAAMRYKIYLEQLIKKQKKNIVSPEHILEEE